MSRFDKKLLVLAAFGLLCGCVGQDVAGTEQLLGAAGFQMMPATTPARQNQLALLPSHQLLIEEKPGKPPQFTYLYADPDQCHCIWIGGPSNYQAFQQLALQQRIAEEQLEAAQLYYSQPFDWGPWGPGFGSTVVIERGHGHEHGHEGEHPAPPPHHH